MLCPTCLKAEALSIAFVKISYQLLSKLKKGGINQMAEPYLNHS